jgi:hypothetical protein
MKNQSKLSSNTLILLLLLSCFLIYGYSGFAVNNNNRGILKNVDNDTIPRANKKSTLKQKNDNREPTTKSILEDLRKSYKKPVKIDTIFLLNGQDTMKVKLKHYCTYDGKINLPLQYLKMYNLTKLQTHDFMSTLEVKINSKVIFKGLIKKADFAELLDDRLKKYGVLLYPNVEFSNDSLAIQYSIAVPLTDGGKGFTMKIDRSGNKHVTAD